MEKRGKTMKGLECCINGVEKCEDCPYLGESDGCMTELAKDALELLKAQKTPTDRLNDVVAEAVDNVQTLMRRVMENADGAPLSDQVAMLCGLADATNKLNFRAEPYDFTSVMGKIMAQGPVAALAPKADKTESEGKAHGE